MAEFIFVLLLIVFVIGKISKKNKNGMTGWLADMAAEAKKAQEMQDAQKLHGVEGVNPSSPEESVNSVEPVEPYQDTKPKFSIFSSLGRDKCDDFSSYTDFREDDIFKPKKPSRRRNMIEPCITEEMARGEYEDHDTYNIDDLFRDKF